MLVLTRADLEALLEVEAVIAAVEEAFREYGRKAVRVLPRQALPLDVDIRQGGESQPLPPLAPPPGGRRSKLST